MFVPHLFRNTSAEEVKSFITANAFAILVSQSSNKIIGAHIPLLLTDDGEYLEGHISRGNPIWKTFEDQEVLCIFQGPHAYISSSWYDHINVPTWNYIAVHVYGTAKIIEGEVLFESLERLVNKYEASSKNPMTMERMTRAYVEKEMKGLVGFQIKINSVEAAYKLSQNRDSKNHEAIIEQLNELGDPQSKAIAAAMKNNHK